MARWRVGGIVALLRLDEDTGGAVDYECMVTLGLRLPGAVERFGWSGISLLVKHAGEGSAVFRALHAKEASFASDYQQSEILASIFDAVCAFAHGMSSSTTNPPRFPRPVDDGEKESFGSGAIPTTDFENWFYD